MNNLNNENKNISMNTSENISEETKYNDTIIEKKKSISITNVGVIFLILLAMVGGLYAVSCYQVNKKDQNNSNPAKATTTAVGNTAVTTSTTKPTTTAVATLSHSNSYKKSIKKPISIKTKNTSNRINCVNSNNNITSTNNSNVNRVNSITIQKTSITTSKKKKKIDFSNKHVNKKKLESLKKNAKVVAYITCKSAKLKRVPIRYGWSDSNVNAYDIVVSDYQNKLFGEGMELYVCGHNYNSLKNLKYAKIGDTILIETKYGANFLYKITINTKSKKVYKNKDVFLGYKTLKTHKWLSHDYDKGNRINIFTCIGSTESPIRQFVKARRIAGNPIK